MASQTLFVGSKDICFFCLRDTELKNTEWNSISSSKLFRFRAVSRFLQMDYRKIFSSSVVVDPRAASILMKSELTVSLCGRCAKATEGFEEICKEFEMARLQLENYVQRVHSVMQSSEKDRARVQAVMKKLTDKKNASDQFNVSIMKNLRMEAMAKCKRKVQTSIPRVMVTRLGEEKVERVKPVLEDKMMFGSKKRTKSRRHLCSHCRASFKSKDRFDVHMSTFHCEQFFIKYINPSVSESMFARIVADLLFQDVEASAKSLSCPYCDEGFKHTDKDPIQVVKVHAIYNHYELLAEKLAILQKDSNLSANLAMYNPNGKYCKTCGIYLKNIHLSGIHRRNCIGKDYKKEEFKKQLLPQLPSKGYQHGLKVPCPRCGLRVHPCSVNRHLKMSCKGVLNRGAESAIFKKPLPPKVPKLSHKSLASFSDIFSQMYAPGRSLGRNSTGSYSAKSSRKFKSSSGVARKKTSGRSKDELDPKVECASCSSWLRLSIMHLHKCPNAPMASRNAWDQGKDVSNDVSIDIYNDYGGEEPMESSQEDPSDYPLAMLSVEMDEGEAGSSGTGNMDYLLEGTIQNTVPTPTPDIILTEEEPESDLISPSNLNDHDTSNNEMGDDDPLMMMDVETDKNSSSPDLYSAIKEHLSANIPDFEVQSALEKVLFKNSNDESMSLIKRRMCVFCDEDLVMAEANDHIHRYHLNDAISKVRGLFSVNNADHQFEIKKEVDFDGIS